MPFDTNPQSNDVAIATAIINRASLRAALAQLKKTVEKRCSIPIVSNVKIWGSDSGTVKIAGTDLDQQLTVTLQDSFADESFATTIPCHKLADIERKAKDCDEIAIDSPNDESGIARLDFQGVNIKMQTLPISDYPEMAKRDSTVTGSMDSGELLAMIDDTMLCISSEETRYYLNGVYITTESQGNGQVARFVATDGHKLAKRDQFAPDFPEVNEKTVGGVIVPTKALKSIRDLLKMKGRADVARVEFSKTRVFVAVGNYCLESKLIDGTFPDYERVIPKSGNLQVSFDRDEMIDAIKAVCCISSERGRAVKLTVRGNDTLQLTVNNPDVGEAESKIAVNINDKRINGDGGSGFEIGYNASYLESLCSLFDAGQITIDMADSGSPALITSDQEGKAYVLMPMRI